MAELAEWLEKFSSESRAIRLRAASHLVERDDTPLDVLLDIVEDDGELKGLGAKTQRALLARGDVEVSVWLALLSSPKSFAREVGCRGLAGSGHPACPPQLVELFDDPNPPVQRVAVYAAGSLGDPSVIATLRSRLDANSARSDVNIEMALRNALRALGVDPGEATWHKD